MTFKLPDLKVNPNSKPISPVLIPNSRIMIVGDFPGKQETYLGLPNIGGGGQLLRKILLENGIDLDSCSQTVVIPTRQPEGLTSVCAKKTEVGGKDYLLPPVSSGKYLMPDYLPELYRLADEIKSVKPNLIIALGTLANWALSGTGKIAANRGYLTESTLVPGIKVLPTYSMGAVLAQWKFRAIVGADIAKAKRESEFPEIRRIHREFWLEPTVADLWKFQSLYLKSDSLISFDIETAPKQEIITCIGFAFEPQHSLIIPFVDKRKPGWNYWSHADELKVFQFLRQLLSNRNPKLAQNGLYDIQWLYRNFGLKVLNYRHDTMLMHHSLQPEMQKGLGFLGSLYTDEAAWKDMRKGAVAKATNKRDD